MQTAPLPCEGAELTTDNGYPAMDDWQIVGRADMTTEQIAAWYEAWYATTTETDDSSTRRYATTALHAWNHTMGRKCGRHCERDHV